MVSLFILPSFLPTVIHSSLPFPFFFSSLSFISLPQFLVCLPLLLAVTSLSSFLPSFFSSYLHSFIHSLSFPYFFSCLSFIPCLFTFCCLLSRLFLPSFVLSFLPAFLQSIPFLSSFLLFFLPSFIPSLYLTFFSFLPSLNLKLRGVKEGLPPSY